MRNQAGVRLTHIVFRHATSSDVDELFKLMPLEIIPNVDVRTRIPEFWREWLDSGVMQGRIIEHHGPKGSTIEGFGAGVFLNDTFLNGYNTHPHPLLANAIYALAAQGESPLLSRDEIASLNWEVGLNLHILHYLQYPPGTRPIAFEEILTVAHSAFRDTTEGYNLKMLCQEAFTEEDIHILGSGGMRVLHRFSCGAMMGLLREDAVKELPGTTVSFSFRTRPPTYYFTFGQQRILELALSGDSDADIANELDISKDAVKQTWRAIYERVDSSSGLGADFGVDNPSNHKRRKLLLDYLRTHPEELRPVKKPRPI